MAMFKAVGPDGKTYSVEAPDPQSAGAALDEMMQSQGGGQQQAAPPPPAQQPPPGGQGGGMFDDVGIAPKQQFDQAFSPSNPQNRAAERPDLAGAMDQNIHGEADNNGRFWEFANGANPFSDELSGALAGGLAWAQGGSFDEGYDQKVSAIRQTRDAYRQRHPVESTAIGVGGAAASMLIGGGLATQGIRTAGRTAPIIPKIADKLGTVGRTTVGGATAGAIAGYGEGEGGVEQRLQSAGSGALIGAGVGAGAGVLGKKIGRYVGNRSGRVQSPLDDAIEAEARALFTAAEQSGVAIKSRPLRNLEGIRAQMQGTNRNLPRLRPNLHPNTLEALDILDNVAKQPTISFADLMTTRQVLRDTVNAAYKADPKGADARFADAVLDEFDEWRKGLSGMDIYPGGGTVRSANQMLDEANRLWTIKRKTDLINDMVFRADGDAAGMGFEKSLRNQFRNMIKNPNKMKLWEPAEQKALRIVAKGGPVRKLLAFTNKVMPSQSLGAAVSGGTLNPVPTGLATVGTLSGKGVDVSTRRALANAKATINSGGVVPYDAVAAKAAGDYAARLTNAAGQGGGRQLNGQAGPQFPGGVGVMFPNDSPAYR